MDPEDPKFTIDGPPVGIDGQRQARGEPQLTATEKRDLDEGAHIGITLQFEKGEEAFYCGRRKIPRGRMKRLLQLKYLIGSGDNLVGDDELSQVFLVNSARHAN
jgi:hypothetical protein